MQRAALAHTAELAAQQTVTGIAAGAAEGFAP
jgi:hypothetical protein